MEWVDGGVTSPEGFRASSVRAGIKKEGLDLVVVDCPTGAASAGLFTSNAVKAAPVIVSIRNLKRSGGRTRAVVINSGNANACNGRRGIEDAYRIARKCARSLNTSVSRVLLASTGVIGRPLPVDKVLAGLDLAIPNLDSSRSASKAAASAIMTTDRVPKEAALRATVRGRYFTIGGMAKGAGMIHPNLATMLGVVTTDARIEPHLLARVLKEVADESFNMISIDRDTSTNDTLIALASGLSPAPEIRDKGGGLGVFREALSQVCISLAKQMVRDGEGATKIFEVEVSGARTQADARVCARTIAGSNLVKSAIFGCDPNWGRIMAAAGYSGAEVKQDKVRISLETLDGGALDWVIRGQQVSDDRNELARKLLGGESFRIKLDLGLGRFRATAWGCDLTYDYVKINSQYTS